jgi:putative transposase
VVGTAGRREVVEYMTGAGLSERRACCLIKLRRKSYRYRAVVGKDAGLEERIGSLSEKHPRYGYRRVWACLAREGEQISRKKVWRLWKKLGLGLARKRAKRKRMAIQAADRIKAKRADHIWTYDFVFDRVIGGRQLKMLTLVDEYTRECLAVETARSITSADVRRVLERVCSERGYPEAIRSDNGSEFIGASVGDWLEAKGIKRILSEPGKPWQNGYIESFNGKLRDELLSRNYFYSLREAKAEIEIWRREYNTERPHSALGYMTPAEFRGKLASEST